MNLRWKLFTPLVALGLLAFVYISMVWAPRYIEAELEAHALEAETHLDTLGEALAEPLLKGDLSQIHATLDGVLQKNRQWVELRLLDSRGRLVYPLEPPADSAAGRTIRSVSKKIQYLAKDLGEIRLRSDFSGYRANIESRVYELLAVMLAGIVLGILFAGIVVEFFLLRPLARLSAASRRLAQGDYVAPLPAAHSDELGALVADFTAMRTAIARHEQELLEENARRRLAEERVVYELIAQQVIGEIQKDSLAPILLKEFLENSLSRIFSVPWLPFSQKGSIFLSDEARLGLAMAAARGLSDEPRTTCGHLPYGRTLRGQGAELREVIVAECNEASREPQSGDLPPHAHVCAPILSGDRFLGVINLFVEHGHVRKQEESDFLRDVAGVLAGAIVRREAETRLTESEGRIRSLVETSSDWIWEMDAQGVYTYVSSRVRELLDYAPEEVLGRTPFDLMPPEEAARVRVLFEKIVAAGLPMVAVENLNRRKNGVCLLLETSGLPFFDAQGRLAGYRGMTRDITARRQAEVVTQRLGRIMDQSFNEIYVFDAASLRFIQVNLGAQRNLGYSMAELLVRTPVDIKQGMTHDQFEALIVPLHEGTLQQVVFEAIHQRKDGTTYPVEVHLQLLGNESPPVFVAIVQDISTRRHLEEDRHARDVALAGSRAKSQFLATMSHEIRTPLNGVLGMAQLLEQTPLLPEQQNYVRTILNSGESLLVLINEILDFSRIEAGRFSLDTHDFELRTVVTGIVDTLSALARNEGLSLDCSVSADIPALLHGDPHRLHQILANLIGNAIKFTDTGGVTIRVSRESNDPVSDTRLRFEVSDTGIGVPLGLQARIFDAFTQVDGSTTRRFAGAGLGLSIARQLVGLMGGEMGVESEPGNGSTFWFTACFGMATGTVSQSAPAAVHAARVPSKMAARGARVLVVEDNKANQMVVQRMLEHLGCNVEVVDGGNAALARIAATRYDLVFMDCQMPDMDGFTATRAIRSREAGQPGAPRLPIVALTANVFAQDRAACVDAGMNDFLAKPVNLASLQAMLDKWLLRRAMPETVVQDGAAPALDKELFAELFALMGANFAEFVAVFTEDTPVRLTALRAAAAHDDRTQLKPLAHLLKGSAANASAMTLSSLCARLEALVSDGSPERIDEQLVRIEAEYQRVAAALTVAAHR